MEEQRDEEEGNCKALYVSREHKNIENKTKLQYHGELFIWLKSKINLVFRMADTVVALHQTRPQSNFKKIALFCFPLMEKR